MQKKFFRGKTKQNKKLYYYLDIMACEVSLDESFIIPDAERLCWLDTGLVNIGKTKKQKIILLIRYWLKIKKNVQNKQSVSAV